MKSSDVDQIIKAIDSWWQKNKPVEPEPTFVEPKFCKNCIWAKPEYFIPFFKDWEFAKCRRPIEKKDIITGRKLKTKEYCSIERMKRDYANDFCGPAGKYWEPK